MSDKPNNFPREGLHQPVTKAGLKQLEQDRPQHNAALHYTIGGEIEAEVHSNLNAEREAAITNGHRRLAQTSQALNQTFDATRPDARTEYIRMQREAARNTPSRAQIRTTSKSR